MKRCSNTNCDSRFLYGNEKLECPFCHSRLENSISFNTATHSEIMTLDQILEENNIASENHPLFSRRISGGIECHGRIVEIEHHGVFNSKWHKIFNAIIRNEPYQFAHQTAEYTIRVENIADEYPAEITDFCLYGNYLGRLQVGDEIIIRAKDYRDRRVVKSIYNQTTSSVVKPGVQIPASLFKIIAVLAIVVIITLICKIVWFIKSGAAVDGLTVLVSALMPIIIVLFGIWIIIRSILPKRRRRR